MVKYARNSLCWCGSEKKYKQCHLIYDDERNKWQRKGYPVLSSRLLKTNAQIDGIRRACQLTKQLLDQTAALVMPGVTTNALNTTIHEWIIEAGAIPAPLGYKGYPKSICTSKNDVVCHGIPDDERLADGDILNIDITTILDGYYGDASRMYTVGTVSLEAQQLIQVTKDSLDAAIAKVKPFQTLNEIAEAIETTVRPYGYGIVEDFGGHGVGIEFHEDPFVYHVKRPGKQMVLVPNMIFTIEPMINQGEKSVAILEDNWTAVTTDNTLSAQWEHTVCVTTDGVDILTA